MMGSHGDGMGLGWLGMGAFWLLLLALIVWLVMRLLPGSRGRAPSPTSSTAAEILDHRMANGEMDISAWRAQRAALQGTQDNRK